MKDPFSKAASVLKDPTLRDPSLVGDHILELVQLETVPSGAVKSVFKFVESATTAGKEYKADQLPIVCVFNAEYEDSFVRQVANLASALTGKHESVFKDGMRLKKLAQEAKFDGEPLAGKRVRAEVWMKQKKSGGESPQVTFHALN